MACNSQQTEFKSQAGFDKYISDPENGFVLEKESGDLVFEARLVPPLSGENSKECTVNLRIKRKDGGAVLEYGKANRQTILEREGYLAFDLKDDVSMSIDGQTSAPIFHHYERNYGLKPSIDILFNFMELPENGDATFKYRDQLFGQGLIKIKFDKELFNKCYVAKQ